MAVVEAFYPGKEGADAIAQAIFGNTNSWGRLPYTVYTSDWVNGTLPDGSLRHNMLDHDVAVTKSTYRYLDPDETKVQFFFFFFSGPLSLSSAVHGGAVFGTNGCTSHTPFFFFSWCMLMCVVDAGPISFRFWPVAVGV